LIEVENERKKQVLPIRTLHDFLFEIDKEWGRFRNGSFLNILTSLTILFLFIPRFLTVTLRRGGPFDKLFVFGIIVALIYNIYLSYYQHNFYQKWEKRLGLLLHLEEQILREELDQ
jgi:hypothetical protein